MRKLNNKGYMLVEIILAFALAFGIAYFILDLTINLKNKNDDLMVETLVTTDQTIIANKIMEKILENNDIEDFDCSKISKSDQTIKYGDDLIVVVNDYAEVGDITCSNELGAINVKVPLSVKQMSDKNFDAVIDYKYDIGDEISPSCTLSVSSSGTITANFSDNAGGSGINYYGWDSGEMTSQKKVTTSGTYSFFIKDKAGNENSCSITVGKKYVCSRSKSQRTTWRLTEHEASTNCAAVCSGGKTAYADNDHTECSCPTYTYYCVSGWSDSGSRCYKYNQTSCDGYTEDSFEYVEE